MRRAGLVMAALAVSVAAGCRGARAPSPPPVLNGHAVVLDGDGKLLSWSRAESPYAEVARLAWSALETHFPVQDNGARTFVAYSRFDPQTFEGVNWPNNPAGLYAMLADSALGYYAFSGDDAPLAIVRDLLDHAIDHGSTPIEWTWSGVPYASGEAGEVDYHGADDEWCDWCGRGDGQYVIEPDKVAELGFAYLRFWELGGEDRYRDAALACADALVSHVRRGDDRHSPWPFRVWARTDVPREPYTANVLPAIVLFDELLRVGIGDADAYARTRGAALEWLFAYPLQNDAWSGYFEDIPIFYDPWDNLDQIIPLQTARWLMEHPDVDPDWSAHVAHILQWVTENFGDDANGEAGVQFGARAISEQRADMAKMGSHTARYAAVSAMYAEKTGDREARDVAFRSFNWASYMCDDNGIVAVGPDHNEGWWFSDGYGDYVRQFLAGMAANPEWAPASETHLLRASSLVREARYEHDRVAYETYDVDGTETLRVRARPLAVRAGGMALAARDDLDDEGFVLTPLSRGFLLRVRHVHARDVELELDAKAPAPPPAPSAQARHGCSTVPGARGAWWWLGLLAIGGFLAALARRSE